MAVVDTAEVADTVVAEGGNKRLKVTKPKGLKVYNLKSRLRDRLFCFLVGCRKACKLRLNKNHKGRKVK